ncbi:WD domain-containing protein [Fusarium sp. MPI-SDFR-AT-0072]|nr:WD domain-containing protein [Fusarium sp. MPI-SDFR-AT-0072]
MAATPSNGRLKLTPSNSPFLARPSRSSRSPMRGRAHDASKLSLQRVIGTTCSSPTGFDTLPSVFAYIAGGAVVVVDVNGDNHTQRFYRARPTAVPLYSVATFQNTPTTPSGTPKANDSRGRVGPRFPNSPHTSSDWNESPSNTWTSRERIKAATCLALSRDGKYLAVGETGYSPRVLVFSLHDTSSDSPLISISEHAFGVNCVAWSADTQYLASLGAANDGFLYIWKVDPRTGAARLYKQNRCTSYVKDMVWMGNSLITFGVRHVKMWKPDDGPTISPTKQKFFSEQPASTPPSQRTLPGRNILLGPLLEDTFTCAAVVKNSSLIICSETGGVCIMAEDDRQMKLQKVLGLDFSISTIAVKDNIAYVGGRHGHFAVLDIEAVLDAQPPSACIKETTFCPTGQVALGFLAKKLVTIDSQQSIDIWSSDHVPGKNTKAMASIPIPGHGQSVTGIQVLERPNDLNASFLTWTVSGNVSFWTLEGQVKASIDVPIGMTEPENELDPVNQLTCARATNDAKLLISADRMGVLRMTDIATKEPVLDIKAHTADCRSVSVYDRDGKFLMASCGRDRTAQLFHRTAGGSIEHFQTLEFAAKVVQVMIPSEDKVLTCSFDRTLQIYDIITKEGDPDSVAAIPSRVISLRASPSSMVLGMGERTVFVSLLDRSICQYELNTGRKISCFKCQDETKGESAVLDSLCFGQWPPKDQDFLLGTSNTDKSIRLYDAQTGSFLDREWGHTEAINGVCLIENDDGSRKVVSVASDGTMMIWGLDLNDSLPGSTSREPSPAKDSVSGRPPLRRVLSKAELAEFQRPSPTSGRRSPPRTLQRRTSRFNLAASVRTPTQGLPTSPSSTLAEDTPSRRPSADPRNSPPVSPKGKVTRRPSLPTLGTSARKKTSSSNLRGFGSLNMATEQTCRQLRSYRKKLASSEPISQENLTELDQELRLTAAALGDRAIRSRAMNETVLSGLLDQYSERLVTLLDEKLRLSYQPRSPTEKDGDSRDGDSPDEEARRIHLLARREGPLDSWRGGPRGMNQPAFHTPLESLLLFQSLVAQGFDNGVFARISEQLINNALIKEGSTYDPARLRPDALQHLFLRLLGDELRGEHEKAATDDPTTSPNSRKRKLGSPPLPTLKEIYEHVDKIPLLMDRLYARYKDNTVAQIREDERSFETSQKEIQAMERFERERRARVASQNGTPVLAARDQKSSVAPNGSTSSPAMATSSAAPVRRGPTQQTPVIPPKPPVPHNTQPTVAPPSDMPTGTASIRPSTSPTPPNSNGSVLQPPAGVPQTAPRLLQAPQPLKQGPAPRPENGAKLKDGNAAPGAALKWEKPYQPPQTATPPPRQVQSPVAQGPTAPPPAQQQQHLQQHPQQHPQQPQSLPQQHQQKPRPNSAKPGLAPPQHAGQLAPPLQPAPPRPVAESPGGQAPHARPSSTTPVPHPRPIQPPQGQTQQVRQIVAGSPAPLTASAGSIAPPQQRWPLGYQPQPPQHGSPVSSPVPSASKADKAQSSQYANQPPRPGVLGHIIRQALNTPVKKLGVPSAPHTPISATPTHVTHGFGTKWAPHSTPSTPGPSHMSVAPQSPAFEPVSPPQKPATLPSSAGSTPRPLRKQAPKAASKLEQTVSKSARGRSARAGQKARAVSSTPSLTRSRRSQSILSHTDEPATQTSESVPKIKDEDATPRPTEDTGDTTADESVPGRPQIMTPGSVSSRLHKRKRQITPVNPPPETTQVLWTRGFTKVSSSALDQISSHRDANMFATRLREKDAPNYRQIVLQPQDITSIRSAIKHGNKAAVQAAASLPGGDPGTAHVWLPISDELVPPKGIINSAQLERELVHMFCNAIMYNADPDRGPGPCFMKRSQDEEEEEVVGYRLDENGVVKNTRSMFVEVEKLLGDLRSAEKERSAPPPSAVRPASVATPAEETGDDEDEGERETGTAKRRRIGARG